jgi:hypothetical protein
MMTLSPQFLPRIEWLRSPHITETNENGPEWHSRGLVFPLVRHLVTLFGREAKLWIMGDFDSEVKAAVHSDLGRRASSFAQMGDLASPDHFRKPSDADLGTKSMDSLSLASNNRNLFDREIIPICRSLRRHIG